MEFRQHGLPVTWLIVDDGGYGILREYMTDAFGEPTPLKLGTTVELKIAATPGR